MNTNPLKDDARSENSRRPAMPTLKKIRDHAIYLARVNGRRASDLKPSDYVEAKRDLMGETENDPRLPILESGPDPEHTDTEPDPAEKQIPATAGEDEHDAGRGDD